MRTHMRFVVANVLALALAGQAFAADPPPRGHGAHAAAPAADASPGEGPAPDAAGGGRITPADTVSAPVEEVARTTHHVAEIGGRTIPYEATAGTLTLRDDDGKPIASMFYVAYVAEHHGPAARPVTFLFNGGPGSSSMWLHLGSLGPVRVRTNQPDPTPAAPYQLVPNDSSLLDKSDLVFLDAIGTGLSRPLGDTKGEKFWGVDQDIDAFARAITRYVTLNERWNSPKFIFGESYGTPRAAGLSYLLQSQGMQLNGVVLLSSILNFGAEDAPGYDQNDINFLPSYAATAWYHNRIQNRPADLAAFVQQARDFAHGAYASALAKGDTISPAELDQTARQMSYFTGLPVEFIERCNLRVNLGRFRTELLRDQGEIIGRLDSRFKGTEPDSAGESADYDPVSTQSIGPYLGLMNTYLRGELGYQTKLVYRPNYSAVISPAWDWRHQAPGMRRRSQVADLAIDLGTAMRQNPNLKVLSLNGYFDFATPFGGTEYDLSHMQISKTLQQNLSFRYYRSGHMVYLNPEELKLMKRDLAAFYDEAAPGS